MTAPNEENITKYRFRAPDGWPVVAYKFTIDNVPEWRVYNDKPPVYHQFFPEKYNHFATLQEVFDIIFEPCTEPKPLNPEDGIGWAYDF